PNRAARASRSCSVAAMCSLAPSGGMRSTGISRLNSGLMTSIDLLRIWKLKRVGMNIAHPRCAERFSRGHDIACQPPRILRVPPFSAVDISGKRGGKPILVVLCKRLAIGLGSAIEDLGHFSDFLAHRQIARAHFPQRAIHV